MKKCKGRHPELSIIIPVLNEEKELPRTLERIGTSVETEVLVVDGGSVDRTVDIAGQSGARVLQCRPGRASQLNMGASAARGGILLFLHGDTRLPNDYAAMVRETMAQKKIAAGAFRLVVDSPENKMQWVTRGANLRAKILQLPYGDQAIFMRAADFREIGGFPEMAVMEDFYLVSRLKRRGRIHILDAEVTTSARRWQRLGVIRTTLINQLMVMGYLVGVPADLLAKLYGVGKKS